MGEFSWELLIYFYVIYVTEQCQVTARKRANGNFSDACLERLHSDAGAMPNDFSLDLVIYCEVYLKMISCFCLTFQPFLIRKQLTPFFYIDALHD